MYIIINYILHKVWRDLGFAFGKFDGQINVLAVNDCGNDTKEAEIIFTLSSKKLLGPAKIENELIEDNRLILGVKSDNDDPEYIKIYSKLIVHP
jgi:hypothetical protein